jgi:hypothetical protein
MPDRHRTLGLEARDVDDGQIVGQAVCRIELLAIGRELYVRRALARLSISSDAVSASAGTEIPARPANSKPESKIAEIRSIQFLLLSF